MILYIEDDPDSLDLMERILEHYGYKMIGFATAEEALGFIQENPPELILMDLQLPGINGLEATKIVKTNPATSHIPVVAVTATAMFGDRELAYAAGCDYYITKPFDISELISVIQNFIENNK